MCMYSVEKDTYFHMITFWKMFSTDNMLLQVMYNAHYMYHLCQKIISSLALIYLLQYNLWFLNFDDALNQFWQSIAEYT